MCVLIFKPANADISENILRGCFERNDDGVGIAVSNGESLTLWRSLNDIDELCARVAAAKAHPAVIHFRYATHGTVSPENVHPFWLNEDRRAVMAHNGIIAIPHHAGQSDTRSFVDNVISYLRPGWWRNPITVAQIEKLIGGSRLVIMEDSGEPHFFNKSSGETTADGVWFSNSQYRQFCDPAAKNASAANIMAETGQFVAVQQRSPYASTGYTGGHQDLWHQNKQTAVVQQRWQSPGAGEQASSRDPFSSTAKAAPVTPVVAAKTPPALPAAATALTADEVSDWTKDFGKQALDSMAFGYIAMLDGVYGEETYFCTSHAPPTLTADVENHAPITAIDLLDEDLAKAACQQCKVRIVDAARQEMADLYDDYMAADSAATVPDPADASPVEPITLEDIIAHQTSATA